MSHLRYQIRFSESGHVYVGYISPDGLIEYENMEYQSLTAFCKGVLDEKKNVDNKMLDVYLNNIVFRDSHNPNRPSTAYSDIKGEIGSALGTNRILVIHRILEDIYGESNIDENDIDSILLSLTNYIRDNSYNLSEDKKKHIADELMLLSNTLLYD